MMKLLRNFRDAEEGAVTVDWVVMTAAVVGLAMGVIAILNQGPKNVGTKIASDIAAMTVDITGN